MFADAAGDKDNATIKNHGQKFTVRLIAKLAPAPVQAVFIETDSPYLAPVPFRGKTNEPAFVRHVAEGLAAVRHTTPERIGELTTRNFFNLFRTATERHDV